MKNKFFVLGMLALVLIFGLALAGCISFGSGGSAEESNVEAEDLSATPINLVGTIWGNSAVPGMTLEFISATEVVSSNAGMSATMPYTQAGNTLDWGGLKLIVSKDGTALLNPPIPVGGLTGAPTGKYTQTVAYTKQ